MSQRDIAILAAPIVDNFGEPYEAQGIVDMRDRKGGDITEWPEDLRVREWPTVRP